MGTIKELIDLDKLICSIVAALIFLICCFYLCLSSHNEIVGMSLFYPRYSTWKGRTIHLEDFIVKQEHRQKGIGQKLFDAVVREAQAFGAKRLEWAVLEWNKPALNFYDKLNAEYDKEWFLAQLREQQINEYQFND